MKICGNGLCENMKDGDVVNSEEENEDYYGMQ